MTLTIRDLAVELDGTPIVADVDLDLPAKSFVAVIGPNGAGKSTLLRSVAGLQRGTTGQVAFAGEPLLDLPARERARRIAYVEQGARSEFALTVRQVVALGRIPFRSMWSVGTDDDDDLVGAALDTVGMLRFADRSFDSLSGGEQQQVQLARALAQQPRLLLLDEPTNHLDIRAQMSSAVLLRSLVERGVSVVAVLHDLNLVAAHCDAVVVMDGGRVVASGPVRSVLTEPLIAEVFGVRAQILTDAHTGRPAVLLSGVVDESYARVAAVTPAS